MSSFLALSVQRIGLAIFINSGQTSDSSVSEVVTLESEVVTLAVEVVILGSEVVTLAAEVVNVEEKGSARSILGAPLSV